MRRTGRSIARSTAWAGGVAALMVLAACSGTPAETASPDAPGGDQSETSDPPADAEPVELQISWWGNDDRAAIMAEAIDLFEEKYSHITVVEQPVGSPDDLFNRLATDFASNTAPDVFALGGAKPQEYGAAGALLDLATVSQQLPTGNYPDFTTTNATVDGKLYGLPTGGNAIGLLINKTIFEEAGVELPGEDFTWQQFVDTANEISEKAGDGIVGLDLRIQDILGTYTAQISELGMYDWEGQLGVDASHIESWFDIEMQLVEGGGMPDPTVVIEHHNVTPDQTLFGTGRAAMAFSYSNQIAAYAAGTGGAEIDIILPPTDTDVSGVAVLPSQFWAIAAGSDHPEEAALLVDWLLNQPEAAAIIKSDRGLPFNPDTLAVVEPLLAPEDALAASYLQQVLEGGVVAPPQPAGGGILNEMTQRIESDIIFGRLSIADGAAKWIQELGDALAAG
ncbi:MAG: extracellular solute-binding protein [Actinomycetales bacterium]|nr:extracellular solute-binding protein [Actinomycetales bacterium]